MPTAAAWLTTVPASPVAGTPVGFTIVTLIFPRASTRSDSDRKFTAAFVAP